jgi:hexulose-6-phosphate isomerase
LIGFMQGRLSPLVDGKIQAFPWEFWREEFGLGAALGFDFIEWTLDQDGLWQNPLMSREGRGEIRQLARRSGLKAPSVTLDCVMQAPFYKAGAVLHDKLLNDLAMIIECCSAAKISTMVLPLVDEGALATDLEEATLRNGLDAIYPILRKSGITISFECDMAPPRLAAFIARFSEDGYGLTYDIGNSAAAGYAPGAEFAAYGRRVQHVHVKDRTLGGATTALGSGDANFESVFQNLCELRYGGYYVLQTARADDDDHASLLKRYRAQTLDWISTAAKRQKAKDPEAKDPEAKDPEAKNPKDSA